MFNSHQDTDPDETQEWIESIKGALQEHGPERTRFLLEKLIDFAERQGARTVSYTHLTLPTNREV